ncbi:putative esterase [Neoconidiobolus thromboides FSU 785]|nr:putative esterase [Neoconidiobolus thromboides FSU 785]
MSTLKLISSNKCYGGVVQKYSHYSEACNCEMKFSIFQPSIQENIKYPGLFYLSGLTCTEDNFIQKSNAIPRASQLGLFLVCPDTSPRNCNIEGENDSYDLGTGAGFYVDATESKWTKHYNMYTYITKELSELIFNNFPIDSERVSIFGHSMGGHGALTIALKNKNQFKSCSAFAPICNPINCNWGKKALSSYLGNDETKWIEYDTCELLKKQSNILPILIHQGESDEFLEKKELLLENLEVIVNEKFPNNEASSTPFIIQVCEGYDHSYWFIQTFINEHLNFHAKYLNIKV